MKLQLALALAAVALSSPSFGLQYSQTKAVETTPVAEKEAVIAAQLPSYPLTTCVISGEPLTVADGPVDIVQDGRLVRLCCQQCVKAVEKDPAAAIAKIDAAVVAQQKPGYPMTACPVSGEELGSMGEPIDMVHGTRLVRLCCKGCVKGFQKEPAKFMAKVDEALIRAQRVDYPLETCVVSGEPLDAMGEPLDVLYGTRLVRLCCKGCKKELKKDPLAVLAKIDAAKKTM